MPQYASAPEEPILSFERGIDRESPRTDIKKGGYELAENVLLACQTHGGKHICTMRLDAVLDPLVTWPSGNVVWFIPYTHSQYSGGVLSFLSHLLIVRDTGQVHRYDTGAPGTNTTVRRGMNVQNKLWTHAIYDQTLIVLNGRDAPMKYGQHFLKEGEARPFLFPLGSKPVSPLGAPIAGESWAHGATSGFTSDGSVPGGGSRVHTQSLRVAGGENSAVTFSAARNFLSGPYPYGGSDFTGSDFLVFQVMKPAGGAANVRIRFEQNPTNHFQFTQSVTGSASWQTFRLQRSTAAVTGTPSWETITKVTFFNDDGTPENLVYFDDCYFLYATAPPALQFAIEHKGRLVGGGAPVAGDTTTPALANLYWSRAGFPDEWPTLNVQVISSGSSGTSRANAITALREFGASVLVGTPHAVMAWTIDGQGNPQRQTVTNEHGIDSHRAVIETPNGALLFPWQRGIYVMRSTWRAFGGEKIRPLLQDIDLTEPQWSVAVFDELTQTLRFWWREVGGTRNTTGIVLDYVRAQELGEGVWPSLMTQIADWATPAYVSGRREVLYCRFNSPQIFRMGVQATGALQSSVTLPWIAREGKDKLTKWVGVQLAYAATAPVVVKARYANNPEDFDRATFETVQTLPPTPGITEQARVLFGRTSRWAQIKLEAGTIGFHLFPPIEVLAYPTARQP